MKRIPGGGRPTLRLSFTLLAVVVTPAFVLAEPPDPEPPSETRVAETLSKSFRHAVEIARPSIVTVRTVDRRPGSDDAPEAYRNGNATGVIVDSSGGVLTSHHAVADAEVAFVELADGREFPVTEIRGDALSDLALLRIRDAGELPEARLGESESVEPKRKLIRWNEYDGPISTVRFGYGFLVDLSNYAQNDASKQQFELEPDVGVRDFRFLLRGRFKTERPLSWSIGYMYDGADDAVGAAFAGGPVALAYSRFDERTPAQRLLATEHELQPLSTTFDQLARDRNFGSPLFPEHEIEACRDLLDLHAVARDPLGTRLAGDMQLVGKGILHTSPKQRQQAIVDLVLV